MKVINLWGKINFKEAFKKIKSDMCSNSKTYMDGRGKGGIWRGIGRQIDLCILVRPLLIFSAIHTIPFLGPI